MPCTQVTVGVGTAVTVRKELVTNLTDSETLIQAAVFLGSTVGNRGTYISKYQEGKNWVFIFEFPASPTLYNSMGDGAGLANFIAANWKSIASLLALLSIAFIVWQWRDASTKTAEVTAQLSDNANAEINKVLADTTLTPQQKSDAIAKILEASKPPKPTDWGMIALAATVIIAAAALLIQSRQGGK